MCRQSPKKSIYRSVTDKLIVGTSKRKKNYQGESETSVNVCCKDLSLFVSLSHSDPRRRPFLQYVRRWTAAAGPPQHRDLPRPCVDFLSVPTQPSSPFAVPTTVHHATPPAAGGDVSTAVAGRRSPQRWSATCASLRGDGSTIGNKFLIGNDASSSCDCRCWWRASDWLTSRVTHCHAVSISALLHTRGGRRGQRCVRLEDDAAAWSADTDHARGILGSRTTTATTAAATRHRSNVWWWKDPAASATRSIRPVGICVRRWRSQRDDPWWPQNSSGNATTATAATKTTTVDGPCHPAPL